MRFCEKCQNLLYPVEQIPDQTTVAEGETRIGKLIYECKYCDFVSKDEMTVQEACVFSNNIQSSDSELVFDQEITQDPALSRTSDEICPACGSSDAVFFQNTVKSAATKM